MTLMIHLIDKRVQLKFKPRYVSQVVYKRYYPYDRQPYSKIIASYKKHLFKFMAKRKIHKTKQYLEDRWFRKYISSKIFKAKEIIISK